MFPVSAHPNLNSPNNSQHRTPDPTRNPEPGTRNSTSGTPNRVSIPERDPAALDDHLHFVPAVELAVEDPVRQRILDQELWQWRDAVV